MERHFDVPRVSRFVNTTVMNMSEHVFWGTHARLVPIQGIKINERTFGRAHLTRMP